MPWHLSRRAWLQLTGLGSLAASALTGARVSGQHNAHPAGVPESHHAHVMGTVGRVPTVAFNPTSFLRTWNFSELPPDERSKFYREMPRHDGTLFREYEIYSYDREIEIGGMIDDDLLQYRFQFRQLRLIG